MNKSEIKWLNDYHSKVLKNLSPYLTKDEINWLREKTSAL
jgi:hypothetical protein